MRVHTVAPMSLTCACRKAVYISEEKCTHGTLDDVTCGRCSIIFTANQYSIPECNHFPVDGHWVISSSFALTSDK